VGTKSKRPETLEALGPFHSKEPSGHFTLRPAILPTALAGIQVLAWDRPCEGGWASFPSPPLMPRGPRQREPSEFV